MRTCAIQVVCRDTIMIIRAVMVLVIVFMLMLTTSSRMQAAPSLPASFYGTVAIDGASAPVGTFVSAWIDDVKVAETATFTADGNSVFRIDIPGDDPDTPTIEGGVAGKTI